MVLETIHRLTEGCLQIHASLICQDYDRPEAVSKLMRDVVSDLLDRFDASHAGVSLDEFGQVADVSNKP